MVQRSPFLFLIITLASMATTSAFFFGPPPVPRRAVTPNFCTQDYNNYNYRGVSMPNPVHLCMSSLNCILSNGQSVGGCASARFTGVCCRLERPSYLAPSSTSRPPISYHVETIPPTMAPTTRTSPTTLAATTSSLPPPTTVHPEEPAPQYSRDVLELICGRLSRGFERRGRVVGGERSLSRKQWPWLASIFEWDGTHYKQKCGAALIAENWVVTASHCLIKTNPSDLLIKFGSDDIAEESDLVVKRGASKLILHEQFSTVTFANDIALIRLNERVAFSSNIIPVCLPRRLVNESLEGSKATLIGWGRLTEEGPMPNHLRFVNVTVISNKKCADEYSQVGFVEPLSSSFICSYEGNGEKDACEGDSGGPLVYLNDGQFNLIGTVSWGIGSNCARKHQPTVYSRVTDFVDWIDNQIESYEES